MSGPDIDFAEQLLRGMGGIRCRDVARNTEGVWLPAEAWASIVQIVRSDSRTPLLAPAQVN